MNNGNTVLDLISGNAQTTSTDKPDRQERIEAACRRLERLAFWDDWGRCACQGTDIDWMSTGIPQRMVDETWGRPQVRTGVGFIPDTPIMDQPQVWAVEDESDPAHHAIDVTRLVGEADARRLRDDEPADTSHIDADYDPWGAPSA